MKAGALYRGNDRVVETVWLADDWFGRLRGLLGREPLPDGHGLLLSPCDGVHTFWMRYPLDVVFLDGGGRVLGWREQLRPWRACRHPGAKATLELRAGALVTLAPVVGDVLHWRANPGVAIATPFGSPPSPHDIARDPGAHA